MPTYLACLAVLARDHTPCAAPCGHLAVQLRNFTTADRMFQTYRDPIDLNCEQLLNDQDFLEPLGRWKLSPCAAAFG